MRRGSLFNWLRDGLRAGTLAENAGDGWLHNIAGEAYVVVPDAFEAFAAVRVRARFVRKCTVRDSPLMATDHPTCRAKAQSLPAPKFWRRRGLQRPLVALQGPSWPNMRGCADQRQPGSDRRRRARRRCCNGKTTISSDALPI